MRGCRPAMLKSSGVVKERCERAVSRFEPGTCQYFLRAWEGVGMEEKWPGCWECGWHLGEDTMEPICGDRPWPRDQAIFHHTSLPVSSWPHPFPRLLLIPSLSFHITFPIPCLTSLPTFTRTATSRRGTAYTRTRTATSRTSCASTATICTRTATTTRTLHLRIPCSYQLKDSL